jgi:hypothetical protein
MSVASVVISSGHGCGSWSCIDIRVVFNVEEHEYAVDYWLLVGVLTPSLRVVS